MKLPRYVISKGWIDWIPVIGRQTANSIGPFIFLPRSIYLNLLEDSPRSQNVGILIHEEVHRKRQQEIGWLWFWVQYIGNPVFRFEEEMRAVEAELAFLKRKGIGVQVEVLAKIYSGAIYLWPVSKDEALKEITRIWKRV